MAFLKLNKNRKSILGGNKMRNKLKKTLVSLLAIGIIGLGIIGVSPAKAQTLKPYGYFELAYVPERIFFKKYENEFMSKVGFGLTLDLKKYDFTLDVGQTTYASHSRGIFFHPNTQIYDCSLELKRKFQSSSFSLFFSHQCVHPVDEKRFWMHDSKGEKTFFIHSTNFTEIGLRFEFGRKKK